MKNFSNAHDIPEKKIAMVEDTVDTLDMIANESNCSTVHVSSFFAYDEEHMDGKFNERE